MTQGMFPSDLPAALLVGRLWRPAPIDGPCVILVRDAEVLDISTAVPTTSDLFERSDLLPFLRQVAGESLGSAQAFAKGLEAGKGGAVRLLAPCDLQPVKGSGVTFAISLVERLIEEQARGDASQAATIRRRIQALIGSDLSQLKPGSPEALQLKVELQARGEWSQYLEVGLGPDAEVFSKAPAMSAVGTRAHVGLLPDSHWNNPEPEVVLAVNSRATAVGAALGNDVNLRDIEGRSALLLCKAKDNNGSCAIGPFVRVFDEHFAMDSIRNAEVHLRVDGPEGFVLEGLSHMREISRDPLDLVRQTCGMHHQYPDGFMLFMGTMFSPTQDRSGPGSGFTHRLGDRVTISSPRLGALVNEVGLSTEIAPWTFGVRSLYANLKRRQLG